VGAGPGTVVDDEDFSVVEVFETDDVDELGVVEEVLNSTFTPFRRVPGKPPTDGNDPGSTPWRRRT